MQLQGNSSSRIHRRFAGHPPEDLLEHRDFSEPSHAPDCQDPESSYWDESSRSWSWVPLNPIPKASKLRQISIASSLSDHGKQSEIESRVIPKPHPALAEAQASQVHCL